MNTIREELKQKFAEQLDAQCDKGESKYGHTLDTAPDANFDWRDMLIQELIDGLQYQEKEIRRLKNKLNRQAERNIDIMEENQKFKSRCVDYESKLNALESKPRYADLDDE